MTLSRFAPHKGKRDANEQQIRDELADAGWLTQPISCEDWPDLLAFKGGRIHLVEVKTEDGRLDGGQKAVIALLALFGVKVIVCRTSLEFLRAVGDVS
jgi:hypothetical protein